MQRQELRELPYKKLCESAGRTWTAKNHNNWNGCVTDRDQDYDTKNTTPTSDYRTKFYAEQYNACPAQLLPLTTDFAAAKSKVDALTPNGGTNQPIGIAWGWQSLTQGAPLNAPAEDANYTYKRVLIVMSDGLNTQDRWPSYGNGQVQYNGAIDARQKHPVRQHQGRPASSSTRCMSTPTAIRPPPFCNIAPAARTSSPP